MKPILHLELNVKVPSMVRRIVYLYICMQAAPLLW